MEERQGKIIKKTLYIASGQMEVEFEIGNKYEEEMTQKFEDLERKNMLMVNTLI